MRIAYLVSRFPSVSETFVLRELDAVAAAPDVEVLLHSLFPAQDESIVHPAAQPWSERLWRAGAGEGAAALAWWLLRRPGRTLAVVAAVATAYARVPRVLPRALATIPLAAAHARRLQAERVEHVHAHFATYPALAAWIAWRLTGVRYSFTAHAHDLFIHQAMLARKAADAAFVVAISRYNERFLLARGGRHPPRVHVVHCGVHPDRFAFRVRRPEPGRAPVIACVAALRPPKGHAVLMRALAGAPAPLADARLELVGDGPLRAELETLAQTLGIAGRVRFNGSLPEDAVAALLAGADLFVLPSLIAADGDMEGVPVALMEALAAGLPAVATRQSGVPELIRDGVSGHLAEPGDAASLRTAMLEALDEADPEARARAGRELVEREFDQLRSARRLLELFRAQAASRSGSENDDASSS
jgi:colanic acid/amylovoran biosynthesis glycosyltransferase